ncbi:glutamine--fructose-6-phosphate aminotransferase [isomerizing] [Algimonas ampicilliniresistens]|uniref:Glutamine--fructose-6-phosphate aminotransferase [isomerizing] n=1 Tax=Algimonas ampicilliniresistens TaxID=1298735 RepID=A0ABQ5VC96_9PROT|nr:glutamine--fructose-6-phosphate transaminase (isomerizing) [Algimonas ampicilliniresistens]GLQ24685.1 glutamine--fructose-6-phosphate aminotransferase [isomerizing] [Algimonas ampicilliniresistens]
MCGIVGIIGRAPVSDRLVSGLKRLEYRGYDSAGIAVINDDTVHRRRARGKIANLEACLNDDPIDGHSGIAHTRWATHGAPTETNAHPHHAGRVALVHNGIIENYADIREALPPRNYESDTDTEVAAHLIDEALKNGQSPREAFAAALAQFRGAYALGVLIKGADDEIFCARHGSPLAIGLGDGEMYLGSDAMALAPLTSRLIYLEEGDWAILKRDGVEIFDKTNAPVDRPVTDVKGVDEVANKGEYAHFMLKEIYEQPETLARTLSHYLDLSEMRVDMPDGLDFSEIDRVIIVACGTAFIAGMVAKYMFEQIAAIPVDIDIASEFRYRDPVLSPKSLMIVVSQSGETADTLAALRYAKQHGLTTAALVNVMTSTMAREADIAMPIKAGPEIGVASTKAFTSQTCALAALAVGAAFQTGRIDDNAAATHCRDLASLPQRVTEALSSDTIIAKTAKGLVTARSAFFLGRGAMVPIALEGALKLKEISYIHAEGYAAGELKHGPIALIEDGTPVIVIAPDDALYEKTVSNLQEVAARGARVILFTDPKGAAAAKSLSDDIVVLPEATPLTAPIVQAIGQQLLAYYTAVELGTDVDQPRNLAKSVTVE